MASSGKHCIRILRTNLRASAFALALAIAFALTVVAAPAQAQTYQVLYSFSYGEDGTNPYTGLTIDRAGNLY